MVTVQVGLLFLFYVGIYNHIVFHIVITNTYDMRHLSIKYTSSAQLS